MNRVRRFCLWGTAVLTLSVLIYLAGPRLSVRPLGQGLPDLRMEAGEVQAYLKEKEAHLPVRPDNGSLVLWGDSTGQPTEHVLLYLHGFTASCFEGQPIIGDFVKEFRVNALLPRLYGHGLEGKDVLADMEPESLYASAREALALAACLGRKVVVMGTSTGCTLALMLAADFPDLVEGLVLYSPNIRIRNPFAPLLSGPWGLQISRLVHGGRYACSGDRPGTEEYRFWYSRYRVEAQVYLQQLLEMRMNGTEFRKVRQPVFMGYYYRDERHQDPTVSVDAALDMFGRLGTVPEKKRAVAFPDAGVHVIACGYSSGDIEGVRKETFSFVRDILGMHGTEGQ